MPRTWKGWGVNEYERLQGAPIQRDTGCRVGAHVYITIGNLYPGRVDWCQCGMMSLANG
jgi:hypothetical protein